MECWGPPLHHAHWGHASLCQGQGGHQPGHQEEDTEVTEMRSLSMNMNISLCGVQRRVQCGHCSADRNVPGQDHDTRVNN